MSKLVFTTKGKEHVIKKNVIHNVKSSASYRIGNTQVICGISTEIVQMIQDGKEPQYIEVEIKRSGLNEDKSPMIESIPMWIEEVLNDKDLFENREKLIVSTEDKETSFYQKIRLVNYIIDDDGSVFDVAILASIKALLTLELQEMKIGLDGLCSYDETKKYQLHFNYHPIPFSFFMENGTKTTAHLSFILTETEINHIHIHGGESVISPELLLGCTSRCRTIFDAYVKRLIE
ncbi:hypothetical protein ENUP19_0211G0017 [Entamoeba nuttalli]|uniref:Ribosomal RNA-processing protein 43 n=1 Tax=Entamoeba nuttalli TaxID=412467 RepID=A0ABQ0DDH6_9EUKA